VTDRIPIRVLLDRIRLHWPEAAAPETDIIFSAIRLYELIRMNTEEALNSFDLTHSAFEVMVALRAQPKPRQLTPTELYKSILLSSGGTTKILAQLERRGLIERVPNPCDGRSKLVLLTQTGEQVTEQAMTNVMKRDRVHFEGFTDDAELSALRETILSLMLKIEN